MAVLAAVMAIGVFFVARAAAREVRLAELKSNFVSSVSHDLKTPLALIQLFAETLELGRLKNTDRAQEYYRIINSEARKLTRLINNILDFSKTEAGLRRYKLEPLDLAGVTRRVLASLESQFHQNQFTVRTHLPAGLPPVLGDAEAVEQALENLLSNAMKYSPGAPGDRRRGRPIRRGTRTSRCAIAASASRRGSAGGSSGSSTASRPMKDAARRAAGSDWPSSTT